MLRLSSTNLLGAFFISSTPILRQQHQQQAHVQQNEAPDSHLDSDPCGSSSSSSSPHLDDSQVTQSAGGTVSEVERTAIFRTPLSVDSHWQQLAAKFLDQRVRRCILCADSSVLDTGWTGHCHLPQHQAREALALEMLRHHRGTPAEVVARWWHLLDDDSPVKFRRLKPLLTPAPGFIDPGKKNKLPCNARRTPALEHGVSHVMPGDIFAALEVRRKRCVYALKFLRDRNVLEDCFGVFFEQTAVGRSFHFERAEWVGDNAGKVSVYDRLSAVLPVSEGGMRGRIGMMSSLIDSNEGLARGFDALGLHELLPHAAEIEKRPKFKADIMEAMRGELFAYTRSTDISWGSADAGSCFTAPLQSSSRMLRALAEHALCEMDHICLLAHFVHVLRVVLLLLRQLRLDIVDEKAHPFLPVQFDPDTYRVVPVGFKSDGSSSNIGTINDIATANAAAAATAATRTKPVAPKQRARVYSLKQIRRFPWRREVGSINNNNNNSSSNPPPLLHVSPNRAGFSFVKQSKRLPRGSRRIESRHVAALPWLSEEKLSSSSQGWSIEIDAISSDDDQKAVDGNKLLLSKHPRRRQKSAKNKHLTNLRENPIGLVPLREAPFPAPPPLDDVVGEYDVAALEMRRFASLHSTGASSVQSLTRWPVKARDEDEILAGLKRVVRWSFA